MSVRLEFVSGSSQKFWECKVNSPGNGTVSIVSYGKIGGASKQLKTKHASNPLAREFCQKASAAKIKKGYVKVGSAKSKPGNCLPGRSKGAAAKAATKKATAPAKATKAVIKAGLKVKSSSGKGALAGKTICFITDDSAFAIQMYRAEAKTMAILAGAQVSNSVKKADVLVVGDKSSWTCPCTEKNMKAMGGEQIIQATELRKETWELAKFRKAVGLPKEVPVGS